MQEKKLLGRNCCCTQCTLYNNGFVSLLSNICSIDQAQNLLNPDHNGGNFANAPAFNL